MRKTGFEKFCLRETHVFDANFNMERSKKSDITEKRPKMAKNIFIFFTNSVKIYGSVSFVVVHDYPLVPDESVISEVFAPPGESVVTGELLVSKVFAP